jgi:hypothetical protein
MKHKDAKNWDFLSPAFLTRSLEIRDTHALDKYNSDKVYKPKLKIFFKNLLREYSKKKYRLKIT